MIDVQTRSAAHRAVAVVGSRDVAPEAAELVRDFIASLPADAVIVSGGAGGVDSLAAESAHARGLRVVVYPADWKKHGRRAGLIRNTQIVEDCTELVAFWNGVSRGTMDSVRKARERGIPVRVVRVGRPLAPAASPRSRPASRR